MSKTKEEILQAKTAHEVFEWLKEDLSREDETVCEYLNFLLKKEAKETAKRNGWPENFLWTPSNLNGDKK